MTCNNLYEELVDECTSKLDRELTVAEKDFIKWIEQKQIENFFKGAKSS
ncbi:hypothetical protein [Alkalicoccobacillus murimartini]|uniref:Uncharacterized protein n=1 Tax=Alkalicoccobacillus murimartini TaxID=171685 RepID=A0ABT9YKT6_9BACI|nr:hypothetical protein [Alkalicoccobacillus murimartini]MDQ0208213.1 hypothetical protein [Alkalicoccobacillus murimartini]